MRSYPLSEAPRRSHIIFFRAVDGGIEVVRILHRRMDFERHLE